MYNLYIIGRLPSFSLPCAVDVLTLGTYPRLPACIKVDENSFYIADSMIALFVIVTIENNQIL